MFELPSPCRLAIELCSKALWPRREPGTRTLRHSHLSDNQHGYKDSRYYLCQCLPSESSILIGYRSTRHPNDPTPILSSPYSCARFCKSMPLLNLFINKSLFADFDRILDNAFSRGTWQIGGPRWHTQFLEDDAPQVSRPRYGIYFVPPSARCSAYSLKILDSTSVRTRRRTS